MASREKFVSAHSLGCKKVAVIHLGYKHVIDGINFYIYKDGNKWIVIHGDSGMSITNARTLKNAVNELEGKYGMLQKFLSGNYMKSAIDEFQNMTVYTEPKYYSMVD